MVEKFYLIFSMIAPKILLKGNFLPGDIVIEWNEESNRGIHLPIENQIETEWQKIVTHAKEKGFHIYNGRNCRLNDFRCVDGKLFLEMAPIEFRTRESLVRIPGYFSLSDVFFRKGIFCSANVETNDGKYVFVELTGKSLNLDRYEMLGGVLETEDFVDTQSIDIFECLYKEMLEEAGILKDHIETTFLKSMFLDRMTNIGFYFEAKLLISSQELQTIFESNVNDPDIENLFFVSKNDLKKQLLDMNENKQLIAHMISEGS